MNNIRYVCAKVKYKLCNNNKEVMSNYFRKQGIKIGKNCNICCNIMTPEPYLISIGNNVTIAGNVQFVTHDNSINKIDGNCANLFGYINIGHNCFIGQNSLLMYGISLADNIIVAAGSVVTKSFDEKNIIIAGNPARKISTWDNFYQRTFQYAMGRNQALQAAKENGKLDNRFIKKECKNE